MSLLVMLDQEAVDLAREAALLRLLAELGKRAEALGLPSQASDLAALLATGPLDAGGLAEKLADLGIDIPDVPELLARFAERYRERLPEELARLPHSLRRTPVRRHGRRTGALADRSDLDRRPRLRPRRHRADRGR